jgi:hypothetical protein
MAQTCFSFGNLLYAIVQSSFPDTSTISFALICLFVIDNREICNTTKINLFPVKNIFQAVLCISKI